MKHNVTAAILAIALLTGCAKQPTRVKPVDFAKVEQKHAEAERHITAATTHLKSARRSLDVARGAVGKAKAGVAYQREQIEAIKTELAKPEFVNAPQPMRDALDKITDDVKALGTRTAEVSTGTTDAEKALEDGNAQTLLAQADTEAATKTHGEEAQEIAKAKEYAAQAVAQGNSNGDIATTNATRADKAEKRLAYALIAAGIATLGCAVLGYLLLKP